MRLFMLLKKLGACKEAVEWVGDKTLEEAWNICERADWMVWLCGKMIGNKGWPDTRQLVLATCSCAETALKYVPNGEERPRIAIETTRAWAQGKATINDARNAAASAVFVANSASSTISAAADDVYAGYYAAAYAAYYAVYAAAVSYAYHAVLAAADAARDHADATEARSKALKEMAEIVRGFLIIPGVGRKR